MDDKLSILYVDDEESNLNIFKNTFRREYRIFTANSANDGLSILRSNKIDLILTDQRMPEMTGVDFLKHTLREYPKLNRILVTGYTDFDALTEAINEAQIFQFIHKPWKEDHLRQVIEQGLQLYKLKKENESLNTELKEKNEKLEKANKELLNYDKLKSDFLSIISHEIRTPLNGLIGPLTLLKEELQTDDYKHVSHLLNILDISVKRLEQFALSAIRLTSFKAKNYQLVLSEFNISEVIKNAISLQAETINRKQLLINQKIPNDITLHADKNLFYICIKEVFENAVNYCNKNKTIEVIGKENDFHIEISIIDQGDGFSEKVLKHLFHPFVTGEKVVGSNVGLDLALVKLIMEAHNGEINISNTPGKGAKVNLLFKKDLAIT